MMLLRFAFLLMCIPQYTSSQRDVVQPLEDIWEAVGRFWLSQCLRGATDILWVGINGAICPEMHRIILGDE